MGLGYVELVATLEQMGRVLLCSPFFSTVCLGVNALLIAGTEAQKNQYLPSLVASEWTGTMCLTEPQCGTDLGQIKTTAKPQENGSHHIDGTKIFISAG